MSAKEFIKIIVPEDAVPGSLHTVRHPHNGSKVKLRWPAGAKPGEVLFAEYTSEGESVVLGRFDGERFVPEPKRDLSRQELVCKAVCEGATKEVLRFLQGSSCDFTKPHGPDGETPAALAIRRGNLQTLKALQAVGVNFSTSCNRLGHTPVYVAIVLDKPEALQVLYECGIKLSGETSSCNRLGHTPAYVATANDKPAALQALDALGVDMTAPCNNVYETPAGIAASYGMLKALKALHRIGVDMTQPCNHDGDKETPVNYAAAKGNVEILRFLRNEVLIDMNAPCNAVQDTPAAVAADNNRADVLRFLFNKDGVGGVDMTAPCNKRLCTPVAIAIEEDAFDAVTALWELGVDFTKPCLLEGFDADGASALGAATPARLVCEQGSVEMAQELKRLGVDFREADLSWCCEGDSSMRAFILQASGGGLGLRLVQTHFRTALFFVKFRRRVWDAMLERRQLQEIQESAEDLEDELAGHLGMADDAQRQIFIAGFQSGWQAATKRRRIQ